MTNVLARIFRRADEELTYPPNLIMGSLFVIATIPFLGSYTEEKLTESRIRNASIHLNGSSQLNAGEMYCNERTPKDVKFLVTLPNDVKATMICPSSPSIR